MVQAFIRRNPHHTIMNMMHLARPWTLASCMKYAYFANTCFVFVFVLSFVFLPDYGVRRHGLGSFCSVSFHPLMQLDHHRGCLFIILLSKGVCAWETKFERANRHFSESNR